MRMIVCNNDIGTIAGKRGFYDFTDADLCDVIVPSNNFLQDITLQVLSKTDDIKFFVYLTFKERLDILSDIAGIF